jgi:ParB family transcriptional regulator, chromosome partitioning protein
MLLIRRELPAHFPETSKRLDQNPAILNPVPTTMPLEFHQLDQCWEHLRVRHAGQQRQLIASLAETGQQTPIVVVRSSEGNGRYVVIDGHKRIAALRQLGRDTVEATVWSMSAADALLLERSLRFSRQESALEQGWLLSEMEQRFRYSREELARRFDRSVSWVGRRLALVELLPAAVQQQVRAGKIAAQMAMKFLAPMARVSAQDCERMAAIWVKHHCDTRQAAQLYAAWREGSRVVRERILQEPELYLKTQRPSEVEANSSAAELERDLDMAVALLQRVSRRLGAAFPEMNALQQEQARGRIERAHRELNRISERMVSGLPAGACFASIEKQQETKHAEPGATERDSGDERTANQHTRDIARAAAVTPDHPSGFTLELHACAGDPAAGESRTLPATDPRSFDHLQGESRASP